MPVYKGDKYLSKAVDSILDQTFSDFEFIIICDDPTPETKEILNKYQQSDSRIHVYYQERQGLVNSLNMGISLAKGEYIARMDADDISLPRRFEKQIEFLRNNPEIQLVGSDLEFIDNKGNKIIEMKTPTIPTKPGLIKWNLFFQCCIYHPTIMTRKSVIERAGGYSPDYIHAEDYELWLRLSESVKLANLPDILLKLRKHENNISTIHITTQLLNANIAVLNSLSKSLNIKTSLEEVILLRNATPPKCINDILKVEKLILELEKKTLNTVVLSNFERKQIKNDATRRILTLASDCRKRNPFLAVKILLGSFKHDPRNTVNVLTNKIIKTIKRSTKRI